MMDVCLLGCGGILPLEERALTSLLCRVGGGLTLIDCGEGTQVPFRQAGWGVKQLQTICFTHYHADHTAGLPGLLLTVGNAGRREPLRLIGPPGLRHVVEGLLVIAPELPFPLELLELSAEESSAVEADGLIIESLPVEHSIPCLAYRLTVPRAGRFDIEKARALHIPLTLWKELQQGRTVEADGRVISPETVLGEPRRGISVAYCTDGRPSAQLADFVAGADLFICEGLQGDEALREKTALKKHMVFSEAAALARAGGCGELWLTHYSPSMPDPLPFLDNARSIFPNTYAGADRMSKAFRFRP